jgi:hypothetical protein
MKNEHLYHENQRSTAEIMDKMVTPIRVELPQETEKVVG